MRRLVSIVVALALLIAMVPMVAFAGTIFTKEYERLTIKK